MAEIDPAILQRIELLVLDVDGVMTDGRITLTPAGEEIKSFHVRDGSGMKYWQRLGKKLAIITGRSSFAVIRRARELGVDAVRVGLKEKPPALESILAQLGVSAEQTAVVGDDLMDLPLFHRCAFRVAVADAVDELKAEAHMITRLGGGAGCVRETIEYILKRTGRWDEIIKRYQPGSKESQ